MRSATAHARLAFPVARARLLRAAILSSFALAGALATAAGTTGTTPAVEAPAAIEEVQVSGERPGPGLWKIRRGENTVYVLGTTSPLPRKMKFRSRELEKVLSEAGLFIPTRPSVDVKAGPIRFDRVGFIDRCHDLGLRVDFWTVDDPVVAKRWAALGVDSITTIR